MTRVSQLVSGRRRGRPPAFDRSEALSAVIETFLTWGYWGTTLDQIKAATGMNRPSIYAAFGDKKQLYLTALKLESEETLAVMTAELAHSSSLGHRLTNAFTGAIKRFVGRSAAARGCMLTAAATTAAHTDGEVRAYVLAALAAREQLFRIHFEHATDLEAVLNVVDAISAAEFANAFVHRLAVKASCGVDERDLRLSAMAAAAFLCGSS
ncbi:TetR/AcrR family transcriptional regulator [Bradyrhizobium lablabi]|uniref:TetR/AcrR family transcriptional regulator n=1 Tax=Bradyrhizobium lablabi TaxID=722472 RepID=UPI001BA8763C|nr:TetR/AcrR family transcriptional regulator [Bradyrhizobium lablabi]MBR0694021.1 TetR/AcrR family transcriptional regulator [Bradyrhizobium lablabi]